MARVTPEVSKYFSDLKKQGHKENPKPREYYVELGKKSAEARKLKKQENE